MKITLSSVALAALIAPTAWSTLAPLGNTAPPAKNETGAVTLLDLTLELEKTYRPIVEISFDDGAWEVEAYKDDIAYELTIDPRTGKILSEFRDVGEPKPPADSLLVSEIIRSLAQADYVDIEEISFERRNWEVECYRNGQKRELHVDPQSGTIVSDRVDD